MSKIKLVPFDVEKAKQGAKAVTYNGWSFGIFEEDDEVPEDVLIRENYGEWEVPTVEV